MMKLTELMRMSCTKMMSPLSGGLTATTTAGFSSPTGQGEKGGHWATVTVASLSKLINIVL